MERDVVAGGPDRILVVDDDSDVRQLIVDLLEADGYAVASAASGLEALDLIQRQLPDVVLLDMRMPTMDGWTFARTLKDRGIAVPTVVLSGGENARAWADEIGATAYLAKPFDAPDLYSLMQRIGRAIVADRRRADEAHRLYAAVVESTDDAIICKNLDGIITAWNPGAQAIYGYSADEVIGKSVSLLFPPERPDELAAVLDQLRQGERVKSFETVRLCKDGRRIDVAISMSPLLNEKNRVIGAVTIGRDVTARRNAERERQDLVARERAMRAAVEREQREKIALLESTGEGIYGLDRAGFCTFVNRAGARALGYTPAELIGKHSHDLIHSRHADGSPFPRGECPIVQILEGGQSIVLAETTYWRKNGSPMLAEYSAQPVLDSGFTSGVVVSFQDVTERKRLEEQLRQAQKMEAIGQLAGGVAHDFNNLLTVISGHCELLLEQMANPARERDSLLQILHAVESAAGLTRQLLAFSRRQVVTPREIDLNSTVDQSGRLLRRLIGEDIALSTCLAPSLGAVKADPGQIEQILLNLAANARDAMPRGGSLTLETVDVEIAEDYLRQHSEGRPGPHVRLRVRDTGCGMDSATLARIFEPFFTTKDVGKGTGLGLAAVYGIVQQSGGWIDVTSEVGRGTSFEIYLPRTDHPHLDPTTPPAKGAHSRGSETILVIEDEPPVLELVRLALELSGYTVLTANVAERALELAEMYAGRIDLVLTDVVMPGQSGRMVVAKLIQRWPGLKVIYMSGYTDDMVVRHGVIEEEICFLPKPFTPSTLVQKVQMVLNTAKAHG